MKSQKQTEQKSRFNDTSYLDGGMSQVDKTIQVRADDEDTMMKGIRGMFDETES